ncbi:methyltransferase domain-containing protein [Actinoplanes sp. NPDC049265]|uniref:methyltransferase domain-containing protein n=1 Tax=Actinoplanes sp. NPDC049265 TaxID=3363902 RepID=UPI0037111F68
MVSFDSQEQPQYLRDYLAAAAGSTGVRNIRAAGLARWEVPWTGRLLDAGCGNGEVARELAGLMPDAEVTAVDFSADAIAEATRGHDGSRVKYEVGDLLDLPYEDGAFDGVRTERVVQHVADADRAIAELTRVLRPGGRMCMIDTDWDSLLVDGSPEGFNDRARTLVNVLNASRPPHSMASGRALRRRMHQAGLTDLRAEPFAGVHTDLDQARQVLPLYRDSPMTAAIGPAFDDLMDDVEAAAADGTFLLTLTMWVVVGTRAR